jgi:hypothetical protein
MKFTDSNRSEFAKTLSICLFSILLLSIGFYSNYWHVAEWQWFLNHQRDTESRIVGKMVISRQDGIFSAGGLTGFGVHCNIDQSNSSSPIEVQKYYDQSPTWEQIQSQYMSYINDLTFDAYSVYPSQIGGQGMLFSLLDHYIPLSPKAKLKSFYILTSILSAVALTMIILWFFWEFGLCVAIFLVSSTLLSQWLVVFGRNLWWSIWAFYLPMIVILYYLKHKRVYANPNYIKFGSLVFISILVKCLVNGYEYMTTTLIMMMVPFVYYSILERFSVRQFLKGITIAVLCSSFAIFLSLLILSIQIASVKGSVLDGITHFVFSLGSRMHGDAKNFPDKFAHNLNARTIDVIITYLKGTYFDLNNYVSICNSIVSRFLFKVRYIYLIFLFFAMSLIVAFRKNEYFLGKQRQSYFALLYTTWFSILAPLSWYIVFKAHSHEHPHMNYIVWQMPFTLFGFAVCGLATRGVFSEFIGRTRRST